MIEFSNKRMFEPIHDELGHKHCQDRLIVCKKGKRAKLLKILGGLLTERIAHIAPPTVPLRKLTRKLWKLLGKTKSSTSNPEDDSSIRFRKAMASSIKDN